MSAEVLATVLLAAFAGVALLISILVWRSQRRASSDANMIAGEANRISRRQTDLDIMEATIQNLRVDLASAQQETTNLRTDLASARTETRKLQLETTTALANISILSDHIREHVPPAIPFPRLRAVPDVG